MTSALQINLGDRSIGTLTMLPSSSVFFAFNEDYLNDPKRPVLSQSFISESGEIIPESKATRIQLPPFFSNLLPEGHMREYLANRGGVKPTNEFKLIELLGEDLSGAVTVSPVGEAAGHHEHEELPPSSEPPFHFSLAGVQLKFSAIAEKHGGLTIPVSGTGGDWIIKLPAQNYANVPENEFAIMHLAGIIGIPVPEIKLVSLADIGGLPEMGVLIGSQALAVKRFDRAKGGKRIHIEDFAQVYSIYPHAKYENANYGNLARMIWTLTGEEGLVDFIRRLAFTIITGNGDMHLKNWSFIYEDGITPKLSPAYDMVSTIPYIPKDGLALNLGDSKAMQSITLEHFKKLAKKAALPDHLILQTVCDTVQATLTAWESHYKQYELPAEILERIQQHMREIALRHA
jgi:serine/threonine-protein kinase HipA